MLQDGWLTVRRMASSLVVNAESTSVNLGIRVTTPDVGVGVMGLHEISYLVMYRNMR